MVTEREMREARDYFRSLLEKRTPESKWQRFFADHPYVLSSALPLRVSEREIVPLGRPGKDEPDFVFYQKSFRTAGIIEIKRPDAKMARGYRKRILMTSRDATGAIAQVKDYGGRISQWVDVPEQALYVGNRLHLFIIMGLSDELANLVVQECIAGSLPPNCTILPYDEVLRQYESTLPPKTTILVPTPQQPPDWLNMVWIEPGEFLMGSPEWEAARFSNEKLHKVTLTKGFWIGATQCTQEQWKTAMRSNPSHYKGENRPVVNVLWEDCQKYCERLSREYLGLQFRLPTEAEWEYACRSGTTSALNNGSACTEPRGKDPALERLGWYSENCDDEMRIHPVGAKAPNEWGLYDMHGNVVEWCEDQLDWEQDIAVDDIASDTFKDGVTNPVSTKGALRAIRGGSILSDAGFCRSAQRSAIDPGVRSSTSGFRVAASQAAG